VATGGQSSGPAVSRGHVYLGTGNAFALLADLQHPPPGSIIALGLDDYRPSDPDGRDSADADRPDAPDRFESGAAAGPVRLQAVRVGSNAPTWEAFQALAGELAREVPVPNGGPAGGVRDETAGPVSGAGAEPAPPGPGASSVDQFFSAAAALDRSLTVGGSTEDSSDVAQKWFEIGEGLESFRLDRPLAGG
jgi:hypothetical protein